MWQYITIFFVLNLIDGGITNYLLINKFEVDEVNFIIGYIVENFGWTGFWIYKVVGFVLSMGLVCLMFSEKRRFRVIKLSCLVFGILVFYMLIFFTFQVFKLS